MRKRGRWRWRHGRGRGRANLSGKGMESACWVHEQRGLRPIATLLCPTLEKSSQGPGTENRRNRQSRRKQKQSTAGEKLTTNYLLIISFSTMRKRDDERPVGLVKRKIWRSPRALPQALLSDVFAVATPALGQPPSNSPPIPAAPPPRSGSGVRNFGVTSTVTPHTQDVGLSAPPLSRHSWVRPFAAQWARDKMSGNSGQ